MKRVVLVCCALVLAGCTSVNYILDTYRGVSVRYFVSPTQKTTYRIFDKPSEGKLMITSSIGNSIGQGLKQGVTFKSATPAAGLFEGAAIEYLASTGRKCRATSTRVLIEPQFEVQYRC